MQREIEFTNTLNTLIANWTDNGIKLNPGISSDIINDFEREVNFSFESSFYQYLKKVNGFVDFNYGEAWFSFWSLSRIKKENGDKTHPENVIWFSDHSLNLCSFGFNRKDRKIYTHFDNSKDILFIAHSFHEFIQLYLEDPYQLIL